MVHKITQYILRKAKFVYSLPLSLYENKYLRYFGSRAKYYLELAWWSIGTGLTISTIFAALLVLGGAVTTELASAMSIQILPAILMIFGGIAILGIFIAFLDTIIRYIKKKDMPVIDEDISGRVRDLEKRMKAMGQDIKEIKNKL